MNHEVKDYKVNLIEKKQLIITGKGDDNLWNNAMMLTDFCSPWDTEKPSKITFRALWDTEKLFFNFTVLDSSIHIEKQNDSIDSINNSDRVELFFRPDDSMNPYYCLEMDTDARLMDFMAHPNKNLDFSWNWPKDDIVVKSSVKEDSFTVEGSISIQSLNDFNLIKNNKIETGIFRAKYSPDKSGNFEPTWITWVNPNTETPNFHIASSFGILILKE
ncbi:Carbohydrate family 9 binding domain-like [Flavobacterium fluvii]|uniref:Carbohydrate family 9 binding domain-like n=1 Tax=Flavobacterium fluvii TaxID=468056 RepID=A0A1M5JW74_9FLAO|nr:sugar-binding protein [Flavobacterium fluvii]SHG44655.1 Carbohydrate family 9 binding domain-like [Flavobacterium fluvii]